MRTLTLFTLFGLKTTISSAGIVVYLVSIPAMAWAAAWMRSLTPGSALLAGLFSVPVMFASDWLHQWGHARAARRTGYPMIGIHYHSLFSASQYPPDEPSLPAQVHLRRALGGFWVNMLVGLLIAPLAFYLWPRGGVAGWLSGFTFVFNFFGGPVASLFPVDIPNVFTNDGGTLLRLWREGRAGKREC
jgi:hypothetical protein